MDITTIFFDFDGVVADTEPLYDIFWRQVAEKYHIGIPDFPAKIKGTTLQRIYELYFSDYSSEELGKITRACDEYEETMDFPEVKGAVRFLHMLKTKGYRVGLVTSSYRIKIACFKAHGHREGFRYDCNGRSDNVRQTRSDVLFAGCPGFAGGSRRMCRFRGLLSGIQAGTVAGMRVIGLATTNPEEAIGDKVSAVIPDFSRPEKVLELLS